MRFHGVVSVLPVLAAATKHAHDSKYHVIKHQDHPHHKIHFVHNGVSSSSQSLNAQKPSIAEVCAGATPGYTGYLISGSKHFYFAYFESRSNPATDPLVMWINGGPGCSSFTGLLHENGPCNVNLDGNGTTVNKHSWVNTANMFYLDQPLGVGFSYDASKNAKTSESTAVAAKDLTIFLKLWYHRFPHTRSNDFHMSGESYAGHYLPKFADHIVKHNEEAQRLSKPSNMIPLKSIIMGNGLYDISIQQTTIYNTTCTNINGVGPVLDKANCDQMEEDMTKCQQDYPACFERLGTAEGNAICDAVYVFCQNALLGVYAQSGRSMYDITKKCTDGVSCYPIDGATARYMNDPKVRAGFGASDAAVKSYTMCNEDVLHTFYDKHDPFYPSAPFVAGLLDRGIRVFMYAGVHDVVCNFVGSEAVLAGLEWTGSEAYRAAAKRPRAWSGGLTWQSKNLRYARVKGAGHFVPYSQPVASLEMFSKWIKNQEL
ncbi:Carboxypeptidase Y [Taphrina deformans PYCC 5710]|uniref:Carboxypeptidase n=1 Tax=Taphrina deformans (strain PYCC 5710 / ATCC 11124 / CBS 356.35 / IMI 108563 / JCM 9778 / NBRC 8474) TaxID=1097556 RepID=R4XIL6_TAPDE|nr:Carboxypeptidase Y [Taphrina deformans PYCC 5710]|eukprot:CCG83207.1 Carboxypeptidase Y [Taphrina deformans PYCC 5710]